MLSLLMQRDSTITIEVMRAQMTTEMKATTPEFQKKNM